MIWAEFHEPVKIATSTIRKYVQPEMVICFGWATDGPLRIICNVLVITSGHETKPLPELLGLFQRHFDGIDIDGKKGSVTVNWLLHSMATVSRLIRWRHPFYCSIAQTGVLMYSSGCIPLPVADRVWTSLYEKSDDWKLYMEHGEQLQTLAATAVKAGLYKFAICNMYLALDVYGSAILGRYLGFKMTTPNIDRLFELLYMVSPEFWKAFPDIGFRNSHSLKLLREAHATIGDPTELAVSKETTNSLLESVRKFHESMMRLKASERVAFDNMV